MITAKALRTDWLKLIRNPYLTYLPSLTTPRSFYRRRRSPIGAWDEHLQKVSRIYLNAYLPEKAHPRRNNKAGSCRDYVLNKGRCVGYDGEVEKWGPEWGLDSDWQLEPFAE